MDEVCFRALEFGATVITVSRRLARALAAEFHGAQRERARSVWNTPDILPLEAFLKRLWWNHVRDASSLACATLLDPLQEQMVWEQVIRDSPAGDSLLRIPETARGAMEAWQLVQAYRLPVDSRFEASDDWAAFADWSRKFRKRCTANNWIEMARLPDVARDLARSGEVSIPNQLWLAAFDELTPQQSELLDALGGGSLIEPRKFEPIPEYWKLRDSTEELRAASAWSRRLLEQNPAAHIGVLVPALMNARAKVERIFREAMHPGAVLDDRERSFHLSLGPALAQYPIVNAALLILEFATGTLELSQAGMLLRSPFLGGATKEWTQRAQIDAKLRRDGIADVSPAMLRERAGNSPSLGWLLAKFEKQVRKLPAQQPPSEWSRDFSLLLDAVGWPGDRTPSSSEYQVIEKWHAALSSLASLDLAMPTITLVNARSRLREIATVSTFQVENEGAPIQIMGLLEAAGLQFDHLWITGLHDEALPAAANPNPFLPISLQRDHKLPHSSAERELEFSSKLLARLLASTRKAVLSYPANEGDRMLGPSPAVRGGRWRVASEMAASSEWVRRIRAEARFEEMQDEVAPAVVPESMQPGGSSLFKDMAACTFRAFAKHRLGARPLEAADLGVNKRDQGNAAHRAMATIWGELGSLSKLKELSAETLIELIVRSAASAVAQLGPGIGRKLEQRRLEKVLAGWLEIEKTRDWFTVRATEQQELVSLGGLQLRTRADRIDRLANGREIILDYKTGVVKSGAWEGDRPDEPQLLLYCATSAEPIAGIAFAGMRIGEIGFKGATESGVTLPAIKRMNMAPNLSFGEQLEEWRRALVHLAEQYRAGAAAADPKPGACEFCGLRAVCRIREFENER